MITTRLASLTNTGDIDRVLAILYQVIAETPQYSTSVKDMEIMFNTAEVIEQHIDEGLCVVATIDDKIVGTCFGEDEGGVIWLSWIAVDPEHQKIGVGEALLDKFIDIVRGEGIRKPLAHRITCSSLLYNLGSTKLFNKMGFVKIAVLDDHWHHLDFNLWKRDL